MAALVQTYTPQPGSVTMLQTRPAASPSGQQYGMPQSNRNNFHARPGGGSAGVPAVYRNSAAIQPYAFTATPNLGNRNTSGGSWQHYASRASSTPNLPTMRSIEQGQAAMGSNGRPRPAGGSHNLTYSPSMGVGMTGSRDDSSITRVQTPAMAPRPVSAHMTSAQPQLSFAQAMPVRPSPDRYRRSSGQQVQQQQQQQQQQAGRQGSAMPSGSGMGAVGHLYTPPNMGRGGGAAASPGTGGRVNSLYVPTTGGAADDTQLYRQPSQEDAAKRLRRRSMHTLDSADYPNPLTPQAFQRSEERSRVGAGSSTQHGRNTEKDTKTLRLVPNTTFGDDTLRLRNGSSESLVSSRSSNSRPSSSANRNAPVPTGSLTSSSSTPSSLHSSTADDTTVRPGSPKTANTTSRASPSSTDVGKRIINPSPLSRPVTMEGDEGGEEQLVPSSKGSERLATPASAADDGSSTVDSRLPTGHPQSPAAKQLAAINKSAKSRSKTSRLRRAFSFSSAAELAAKSGPDGGLKDGDGASKPEPAKLHKDPSPEEMYEAEQARIAKKQEESGIGNSIYGGRFFSGSTDNLSISSTASSASIMIRKMGRGMKKTSRSLVGLFRPKSIVGAPAAEGITPSINVESSAAAVTMLTVEAERERVNINLDPHSQAGGGTSFPHLERNSIDASRNDAPSERLSSSGTDHSGSRKSIVGGDKERAEVLAAVRKGILKKAGTSPTRSPIENGSATDLPGVPAITDSPNSSAPSTPNDDNPGHKRSDSVAIGNEDYFVSALRLRQDSKGVKRNATFSPRIVFYDTWPSQEYDRRGEIATCNRLTPMLAQQIKEELNTFKMEMEVHENSKIYTHFF